MGSFFKPHLYKLTPALLLFTSFLFLSGPAPKNSAFWVDNELIVLWEDTISEEESGRRLSALCPDLILTEHFDDFSLCTSTSPDLISTQLQLLNNDASVRVAEQNYTTSLCNSMRDMEYKDAQWAFHNTGDYTYYIKQIPIHRTATADIDINLPEAYELMQTSPATRPVTVAIIDTGVDITHPALQNHIWVNENEIPGNGIDDDDNGYIDDVYGWDFYNNDNTVCHYQVSSLGQISALPGDNDNHGTHCAGIIAATEGVFGVAGGIDIRILPLKIHGGTKNSGSVADAIHAVKYAQAAGADICNMSWGTPVYSEALETVMRESDMLFVVAAGNSGSNNNSSPLYPASYSLDNMISVAYVTQFGGLASDSNYGLSTVDIAAPGQDILSTTVGGEYHYLSGSSMAAPVVSGVAALLYAQEDSLYPQNIKELLLQTLKPLDSLVGYIRYPGIVDAAKALAATDSLSTDKIAPTLFAETTYQETILAVTLHAEDLGGSGIRTLRYAVGAHDPSYFCHGTAGQPLDGITLYVNKPGTYTFYAGDYAGNETTLLYRIQDDSLPPTISADYKENPDGTFTIHVSSTDTGSGIKRLRYMEGRYEERHFLAAGRELEPDVLNSFSGSEGDVFTFYSMDHRGNKTIYVLEIIKQPAEHLFLNVTERTLRVDESFSLVPLLLPFTTTDCLSYSVDDETLLYVAADGILTGLAPGTATVTVTASGGLSASCTIHVTLPTE